MKISLVVLIFVVAAALVVGAYYEMQDLRAPVHSTGSNWGNSTTGSSGWNSSAGSAYTTSATTVQTYVTSKTTVASSENSSSNANAVQNSNQPTTTSWS